MIGETEFILVRCPKCGAVIGRMVPRNGSVKLLADGWEIGEGKRECRDCQTTFHFVPPAKGWQELVTQEMDEPFDILRKLVLKSL